MNPVIIELLLSGTPSWVLPGAAVDVDLANNRYWGGPLETLLSCSRASEEWYVPTSGLAAFKVAANVFARGSDGLGVFESRTTLANKSRRLDDAAQWTLSSITTSVVQGIDLVLASATRLTAGSSNGTCLGITNTSGSAARRLSPYIRRVAGTGNIDLTLDGGSTWTTLVGITSAFSRLGIGQTVANPQAGIRIASSGDQVDIDFANGESGAFDTPPIESLSGSAVRAADAVTATGALATALGQPVATVMLQTYLAANAANGPSALGNSGTNWNRMRMNNATTYTNFMNAVSLGATLGAKNFSTDVVKWMAAWDATGRSIGAAGAAVVTDANTVSGSPGTFVLSFNGSAGFIDGYYQRITAWNSRLSDSRILSLTTP